MNSNPLQQALLNAHQEQAHLDSSGPPSPSGPIGSPGAAPPPTNTTSTETPNPASNDGRLLETLPDNRLKEAETLCVSALAINESVFGPHHPQVTPPNPGPNPLSPKIPNPETTDAPLLHT